MWIGVIVVVILAIWFFMGSGPDEAPEPAANAPATAPAEAPATAPAEAPATTEPAEPAN
jgi:hypothetical protein